MLFFIFWYYICFTRFFAFIFCLSKSCFMWLWSLWFLLLYPFVVCYSIINYCWLSVEFLFLWLIPTNYYKYEYLLSREKIYIVYFFVTVILYGFLLLISLFLYCTSSFYPYCLIYYYFSLLFFLFSFYC